MRINFYKRKGKDGHLYSIAKHRSDCESFALGKSTGTFYYEVYLEENHVGTFKSTNDLRMFLDGCKKGEGGLP